MKLIWIEYREIFFIVVFLSFGILWLSLNYYVWECYKLKKYRSQIHKNGKIINSYIGYPFFNPFLILNIFTSIPSETTHPQYYKFKIFREQVRIIIYIRKIYKILFPIYVLFLIPLLLYLDNIFSK